MTGSVFGPVEIPAAAWRQDDVCRALELRHMAAVLRLVQRYGSVSQVRLANATGIAQGRVNEIVNGRRQVTALEVFERIADGVSMPDEARMLVGLRRRARPRGRLLPVMLRSRRCSRARRTLRQNCGRWPLRRRRLTCWRCGRWD